MMCLHEAIEKLLKQKGHAMTSGEIADALNKTNWYEKGDKSKLKPNQIHARVNKYPHLFDVDRSGQINKIGLKKKL
jgi:hypothetical protein